MTGAPRTVNRVAQDSAEGPRCGSRTGAPFLGATRCEGPRAPAWWRRLAQQPREFGKDSADSAADRLIPRRKWQHRNTPLLVRAMPVFRPIAAELASSGWQTIGDNR